MIDIHSIQYKEDKAVNATEPIEAVVSLKATVISSCNPADLDLSDDGEVFS